MSLSGRYRPVLIWFYAFEIVSSIPQRGQVRAWREELVQLASANPRLSLSFFSKSAWLKKPARISGGWFFASVSAALQCLQSQP